MGNKSSFPRRTKQQATQSNQKRLEATQMQKENIQQMQNQWLDQSVQQFQNKESSQTTVEIFTKLQVVNQMVETSKQQLDRDGKPLTKADLVAIIVALEPQTMQQMDQIQSKTVQDLNALIRILVYNPHRYMEEAKNPTPSQKNVSLALVSMPSSTTMLVNK